MWMRVFKGLDAYRRITLQNIARMVYASSSSLAHSLGGSRRRFPSIIYQREIILYSESGIIIPCLYPQLLVLKFKSFQIQYCIFIKVSLILFFILHWFDLVCRLIISTSGAGRSGREGIVRPKRQKLQKEATGSRSVSERKHPQKRNGQLWTGSSCV